MPEAQLSKKSKGETRGEIAKKSDFFGYDSRFWARNGAIGGGRKGEGRRRRISAERKGAWMKHLKRGGVL